MDQPSPHALPFGRYRELLDREYGALSDPVGPTLHRPVPGCPDWNGEDLVRHTAIVFLQKAETIRTGRKPGRGWPPVSVGSFPPQALLAHCYGRLIEQFDAHAPGDPAETWLPEDQTAGSGSGASPTRRRSTASISRTPWGRAPPPWIRTWRWTASTRC